MALNDGGFIGDLTNAFNQDTWDSCANLFATAVKSYLDTGSVMTTVTATVVPPSGPPYIVGGQGNGIVVTIPPSGLYAIFVAAFQGNDWSIASNSIANAINTYVISCTATISSYTAPLVGSGTGPIVATGLAGLISGTINAFNQDSWSTFATVMGTSVKTFITTCTITTVDLGVVPQASWTGVGTGTIS